MKAVHVAYFKLDLNYKIIEHNDSFVNLFHLQKQELKDTYINSIPNIIGFEESHLSKIQLGYQQPFVFLCNAKTTPTAEYNAFAMLYMLITRQQDYYSIRIVNWLNWLHNLAGSMEHGYSLMSNFNDTTNRTKFSKVSDASCYKAFYPLITYIPNKLSSGVSQSSLFEIMRIFVKQRGSDKYSRDYARNVYSRIRTNLKHEYQLESTDVIDLIKNKQILNLDFDGQIYVPHTVLVENIILQVDHDPLLSFIIETLHPNC